MPIKKLEIVNTWVIYWSSSDFSISSYRNNEQLIVIVHTCTITIIIIILQTKKFLKCDWLRPVVFKPNLKYLHVKITASHMLL